MSKHNEKARFSELDGKPAIERYSAGARLNHWVVAICFVLLALSGLAFFHPGTFWLSNLFGSGTWARILHPFIGVLMFISFCGLFVRFVSHNFLSKDDIHWIINFKDVISNNEAKIPPAGRYNAGQKFLFWALFWLMLGLMATGIVIWRSYFSHYFSVELIRAAVLLHAVCGFGLICTIIIHVYAAIWVQGTISAMIRGKVSYGWVKHNHPAWYKEIVESEKAAVKKG
ncbi:Formate dehydrogenase, cytochrome b556(fdo) subunit [Saezia sanguinis]|uniref:Formate dehydrogenase, cytochrome b556(Fdo) subunit n=1 Tax=Saezia sanguinis TaxID=1965230 RepID=A0A433S9Q3_9BURK|nr:formate dehydrogenase subunit gamma [Saezia sanguinis]RUS65477.1 Formate dehydrogenase, cytochrome b556(fdo) subunit [Saezia sanguinis]